MEVAMAAVVGKSNASHCVGSAALESSHKRGFDVLFAFSLTSGRSVFTKLLFFTGDCSNWWSRLACRGKITALRTGGKLRLQCLAQDGRRGSVWQALAGRPLGAFCINSPELLSVQKVRVHRQWGPRPAVTGMERSEAFSGSHSRPSGKPGVESRAPAVCLGASSRTRGSP